MIRRHITVLRLLFMIADGASAILLFGAISFLRFGSAGWLAAWSAVGPDGHVLGIAYAATWVTSAWLLGLYRLRARLALRNELTDLLRADVLVAVATFAILFLFKLPGVSRLFLVELFAAQLALAVVVRVGLRLAFTWARAHGYNTRWVLVVGTGPFAEAFADRLERHQELGLRVIGHLECHPDDPYVRSRRTVLGRLEDVSTILHERVVDEVAICLPVADLGLVEPVARLCEEEGRVVRIPVGDVPFSLPGGRLEELDGRPILSLVYGPDRALGLAAKRLLDIIVACAALIVLSPAYLGIAAWVRAVDGSPILFRQERVGLHGRKFEVVKFRSMVPDAEAQRKELAAHNEINGPAFKLSHDPRLSRTGGTLRRTSLDELPQFWNVLRGEMSIVGPRPPLPDEVADYDIWHRRRLSMKPGITGLWQVAARREQEFDRWVSIDLDYIDRWSLWLDFKIMVRTVPAMLQGR